MSARRRRNQPDDGFDLPEENGEFAEYETADDLFSGNGSGEEYPEEYPDEAGGHISNSDPEAANLSVGDDRLSCSFTALKPSGKNELTVKCYGMEYSIPVYLWKR